MNSFTKTEIDELIKKNQAKKWREENVRLLIFNNDGGLKPKVKPNREEIKSENGKFKF